MATAGDHTSSTEKPHRVMFLYWGRRGLTQFVHEVARTAIADAGLAATISVSRQNESFHAFEAFGPALFPIDTFSSNTGVVTQAWRLPFLRRRLVARLREDETQAVIDLMPHAWSSLIAPAIRSAGVRYVAVVHDADAHPGDHRTRWAKTIFDRAINQADLVLTLSDAVTDRLVATGRLPRNRIATLFHPDLGYGPVASSRSRAPGAPLRLLWLGRIMHYKGLPLFLDAVDLLRADGHAVEIGVFGEGPLGTSAARLDAMGAEVINRWLTKAEIADALGRFDAIVLSHIEASQSGVAATALGAGLPVIATPVGGLVEQVSDGETGILAARADAPALAEAIRRLARDWQLYTDICRNIARTREARSMQRFVDACVSHATHSAR